MAERKPFLLRLDPALHDAVQRWAADDLRSLNGQIEFLLRQALRQAGRLKGPSNAPDSGGRG
ncbi:MAG TPA: DNA-binding protein [Gemmatimonadales bacterium]|nr:DNA-binding protein [Gemmatimonadales bacterium]